MGALSTKVLRAQTSPGVETVVAPLAAESATSAIVAIAAIRSALRIKEEGLWSQRFVVTVDDDQALVVRALHRALRDAGMTPGEAVRRVFPVHRSGLLVERAELDPAWRPLATPVESMAGWSFRGAAPTLSETLACAGATVVLRLDGSGPPLEEAQIHGLCASDKTPLLVDLTPDSHPSSRRAQIVAWSARRAMVLDVAQDDVDLSAIADGVRVGADVCGTTAIDEEAINTAAVAVARWSCERWPRRLLPPPTESLAVARIVASEVARAALRAGYATAPDLRFCDIESLVEQRIGQASATDGGGA